MGVSSFSPAALSQAPQEAANSALAASSVTGPFYPSLYVCRPRLARFQLQEAANKAASGEQLQTMLWLHSSHVPECPCPFADSLIVGLADPTCSE